MEPAHLAALAVARGEVREALQLALQAWRARPCPVLARAIEELSARIPSEAGWEGRGDLAPEPDELPALLRSVFDQGALRAAERLERARSWPSDPRVDRWCVESLESMPYRRWASEVLISRRCWQAHLDLLDNLNDPSLVPRLESLQERLRLDLVPTLGEWVLAELQTRLTRRRYLLAHRTEQPSSYELLDAIPPLPAAPPSRASQLEDLFALVLADPDDDAPRLVWADAMILEGDPRGEFVSRQIRGAGDTDAQARLRLLLEEHGESWLGPLSAVIEPGYVFERGWLVACRVAVDRPFRLRELAAHPGWWSVERLAGSCIIGLHPARRLRELEVSMDTAVRYERLTEPWAELFERTERPIEVLHYEQSGLDPARELPMLGACRALPRLHTLALARPSGPVVSSVLRGPVLGRLATLRMSGHRTWLHAMTWLGPLLRDAPVRHFVLKSGERALHMSLTRGDAGYERLEAALGARGAADRANEELAEELVRLLAELPALRELRLELTPPVHPITRQRVLETVQRMRLDRLEIIEASTA
jgi:uncharacterized protein (TIGR02996 family)